MTIFEPEQQTEYVCWTYDHPRGFVLVTADRGRFRLHHSMCEAIFWTMTTRIAGQRRYCFEGEDEARQHSIRESKRAPLTCDQCRS